MFYLNLILFLKVNCEMWFFLCVKVCEYVNISLIFFSLVRRIHNNNTDRKTMGGESPFEMLKNLADAVRLIAPVAGLPPVAPLDAEQQEAIQLVEDEFAFLDELADRFEDPFDRMFEGADFEEEFEPLLPIEENATPGLSRHRSLFDVRPREFGLRRSASCPHLLLD